VVTVTYFTRAYCRTCDAAIWSDTGGGIICACGYAQIEHDIVLSGDAVTDEKAFKAQAASDLGLSPGDITIDQGVR